MGMSNNITVSFYDTIEDEKLQFAVIIAKYQNQYIFCKHKLRDTFEFPGGKREPNETILDCAKRELYEETGATTFDLTPCFIYSVKGKTKANLNGQETFGLVYEATIHQLSDLPPSEIEKIIQTDTFPNNWTYPEIQPFLLKKYLETQK